MKIPKPNHRSGFSLEGALVCILILGLIGGCAIKAIRDQTNRLNNNGVADQPPNTIEVPYVPAIPSGVGCFLAQAPTLAAVASYDAPMVITISMGFDQLVTLSIRLASSDGTFVNPTEFGIVGSMTGVPVTIQWSGDLDAWEDIATVPVTPGVPLEFTDYIPPSGRGFYRTRQ